MIVSHVKSYGISWRRQAVQIVPCSSPPSWWWGCVVLLRRRQHYCRGSKHEKTTIFRYMSWFGLLYAIWTMTTTTSVLALSTRGEYDTYF